MRYEEVFDQMDLYVKTPHTKAITIRPNTVGSTFWRQEFLASIRGAGKEGKMLDKLKAVANRYEAIVSQLEDPAVYADSALLAG